MRASLDSGGLTKLDLSVDVVRVIFDATVVRRIA
jgi:hypothetical protein